MLNFFRSESGNYVVGAIVVGIIVVFALEFRTGRGNPTAAFKTACAVSYGGECLDQKDYFAALGLVGGGVDPKQSRALSLRKRVLEGLAERELLIGEAQRLGLGISDEVIERELTAGRAHISLPAAELETLAYRLGLCRRLPYGGCEPGAPAGVRQLQVTRTEGEPFDYALYEKEIRIRANRGPKEFRAAQERELLAEAMRDLVRQRARISEDEAFAIYERGRSQAVARTVVLERSWFAKMADTTDAAVDHWASEFKTQVDDAWKSEKDKITAGCPLVSELAVELPPNALETEKAPIKEKIEALRQRIQKGEAFEAVARQASNAPSAAFGGKVGCLHAGDGLAADVLLEAAKKLTPGALSEVIETPRAFYLLRLDGKLEAANVEREGRRQVARGLYVASVADQAMHAFATELVQKTQAGAKLEDVTRALSDEVARRGGPPNPPLQAKGGASLAMLTAPDRPRFEVSSPFSLSGNPLPEVETKESVAARAFALNAPDAVDPRPVETASGLVVLQLKEKTPASREDFAKEKWKLVRMLQESKASEALARYVADLRRAAGSKLKVDDSFAQESKASSEAED
ncbi:MAG TPA: peptidylprolyl isomerase [Polyangiaceae bacterium]|nr:peptidylprolyl isomerase [Polyangiaceae bacterium]